MKKAIDKLDNLILFQSNLFDYRKGSIVMKNGNEIFMEHRLKELFLILLKNKNDFVSREKLMAFVWKDVVVTEQSITKAISDLRKFFIKNDIENLNIITVSKIGYKLEIKESPNINEKKNYSLKLSFKILAYAIGIFIAIIIIIRAMRYEQ